MGPTASTPPPRSTTLTIPDSPEPSTSAAASASGSATEAPPYLPRPLGVSDPPRTTPLTVQEKKARLLDEGARKAERKHLLSEMNKGYYEDWNNLKHGTKLWMGPPTLIREERSLYMPDIKGVALKAREAVHSTDLIRDRIALVTFESTRMAEQHVLSFTEGLTETLGAQHDVQVVRINSQENILKSWLVSLFIANLRRSVPAAQQASYLLSQQTLEYVREPMGMANKLIGYAYLVDDRARIRWAGCGFASPEEVKALGLGAKVLLSRLEKRKSSTTPRSSL